MLFRSVEIKKGFNFIDILAQPQINNEIDLNKEAKGFAWIGVKRYLANTSDMLEPAMKRKID